MCIRDSLKADLDPPIFDVRVSANLVSQALSLSTANDNNRRSLQQGVTDLLTIQFDVEVSFRSTKKDHPISELVYSAFATPLDRTEYVIDLQGRPIPVESVEDVLVQVQGVVPDGGGGKGKPKIAIIVGSSVGGAALLLLLGFLVLRRSSGGEDDRHVQARPQANAGSGPAQKIAVST